MPSQTGGIVEGADFDAFNLGMRQVVVSHHLYHPEMAVYVVLQFGDYCWRMKNYPRLLIAVDVEIPTNQK